MRGRVEVPLGRAEVLLSRAEVPLESAEVPPQYESSLGHTSCQGAHAHSVQLLCPAVPVREGFRAWCCQASHILLVFQRTWARPRTCSWVPPPKGAIEEVVPLNKPNMMVVLVVPSVVSAVLKVPLSVLAFVVVPWDEAAPPVLAPLPRQ